MDWTANIARAEEPCRTLMNAVPMRSDHGSGLATASLPAVSTSALSSGRQGGVGWLEAVLCLLIAAAIGLGMGLAAIQLLPTLTFNATSMRSEHFCRDLGCYLTVFSLPNR